MNALVINPWVTDFKLYDEWMHPVGLYMLISLLEQNDWHTQYFNCLQGIVKKKKWHTGLFASTEIEKPELYTHINRKYKRYGVTPDRLREYLSGCKRPDAIFVGSFMTYWFQGLDETLSILNEFFKGIPIFVGGISAILIPEIIRKKHEHIHVCSSLIDLANHIPLTFPHSRSGYGISMVPGLKKATPLRHGPLLSSLGCPMRCTYCASPIITSRYHTRNKATIIDEITHLRKQGVKNFSLYDDAFLYRPQSHFVPLMEDILRTHEGLHFHTPNGLHLNWISPHISHFLKNAGFETLRFGFESSNSNQSKETGNKISRRQTEKKVSLLLKTGFLKHQIGIYIMGGLPSQTPHEMIQDIAFIHGLGVQAKPVFLSPVPGTPIFNYYAKKFPELTADPLWHNDSFFITRIPAWSVSAVQEIRDITHRGNGL